MGLGVAIVLVAIAAGADAAPRATPPLVLSINDTAVVEGNAGTVQLNFTITLSAPSAGSVSVLFNTADGTATAPSDYDSISQLVTFSPGDTAKVVQVTGHGDTTSEQHEYFIAYISEPVGAIDGDDVGYGTFVEDDLPASPRITSVAGSGITGYGNDGYLALSARWSIVDGVAVDGAGRVYTVDESWAVIRRFTPGGTIELLAGIPDTFTGYNGDGIPAVLARLDGPQALAVDFAGVVYIADTNNQRIRRVGLDGIITTIAGDGFQGNSGDGGLAVNARLRFPRGVAVDSLGNVYVADSGNNRIRKIGTDGKIRAFAGNGVAGFGGDGGLARSASLNDPEDVDVAPSGLVTIADTENDRVRVVDASGYISTVAGTGVRGFAGDGGPAVDAALAFPRCLAAAPDGSIYISEWMNNVIRKVAPNGVISTLAGSPGVFGFAGDGQSPSNALLRGPAGLVVDALGRLYISDTGNTRVREVAGA